MVLPTPSETFAALEALYEASGGAQWGHAYSRNWLNPRRRFLFCQGDDGGGWYGVGCLNNALAFNASTNPVVWFSSQPKLLGTLPTQMGRLQLKGLDLSDTSASGWGTPQGLSGTLPTQFSALTFVNAKSIPKLSGTLPATYGPLAYLDVKGTSISGTITTNMLDHKTTSVIDVGHTAVSGTIPTQIGRLSQLNSLHCESSALSGTIPVQLGSNVTQLIAIHLDNANLSGTVPSELGLLGGKLTQLTLYGNRLSGTLPTQLGGLSRLQLCQFTWFQVRSPSGSSVHAWPQEDSRCNQLPPSPHAPLQVNYIKAQGGKVSNHFDCGSGSHYTAGGLPSSLNYACTGNLFCSAPPTPPPPTGPPPPSSPHQVPLDFIVVALPLTSAVVVLVAVIVCVFWRGHLRNQRDARLLIEREQELSELKGGAPLRMTVAGMSLPLREAFEKILMPQLGTESAVDGGTTSTGDDSAITGVPAQSPRSSQSKYQGQASDLTLGQPKDAALGVARFLGLPDGELAQRRARGVQSIVEEVTTHGSDEVKECLHYVLQQSAGSSPKLFANSPFPRDCDAAGLRPDRRLPSGQGMLLADFVNHPNARIAELSEAHVLALRLYSTAAFVAINAPLRDSRRSGPHPLAVTVDFLAEAIRRLRSVEADAAGRLSMSSSLATPSKSAHSELNLWRGLKDRRVPDGFEEGGGSELAPMSATSDVAVAVAYSRSSCSLLLKITTSGFVDRGVDVQFLSCFPAEAEFLYPPLTFLKPTGRREVVHMGTAEFTVIEVRPFFGS